MERKREKENRLEVSDWVDSETICFGSKSSTIISLYGICIQLLRQSPKASGLCHNRSALVFQANFCLPLPNLYIGAIRFRPEPESTGNAMPSLQDFSFLFLVPTKNNCESAMKAACE